MAQSELTSIISRLYEKQNRATLATMDAASFLRGIPSGDAACVLTSPPYNIGKSYERRISIGDYIEQQREVISECVRITKDGGSICWQVGNFIDANREVIPLDIILYPVFKGFERLKLRNRIAWTYTHGQHASNRFSGRYETILWFTKGDNYTFNLDAVRVPQKYPGKRSYRGPNKGKPSCNPLGKNPGDVWEFPNVCGNHIEKTAHPCQFPHALAETLILALTNPKDLVVDPFLGSGTTAAAAVTNERRAAGCDLERKYVEIARGRVREAMTGTLNYRPRNKPVMPPQPASSVAVFPREWNRSA